jgi:hypothetical protein
LKVISQPGVAEGESVRDVLWRLVSRPYDTFILRWNWKAALFSAATRAPIFLMAALGHGWRRASIAMTVEAAFRIGTTGFLAAGTQAFRSAKPKWMAVLIMSTGFPLLTQALDGLLHEAMGTPNLAAGILASLAFSALSSVFSWYVMRRGTLLIGREGNSLWADLKSIPMLVVGFVLEPPVWAWRFTRQCLIGSEAE